MVDFNRNNIFPEWYPCNEVFTPNYNYGEYYNNMYCRSTNYEYNESKCLEFIIKSQIDNDSVNIDKYYKPNKLFTDWENEQCSFLLPVLWNIIFEYSVSSSQCYDEYGYVLFDVRIGRWIKKYTNLTMITGVYINGIFEGIMDTYINGKISLSWNMYHGIQHGEFYGVYGEINLKGKYKYGFKTGKWIKTKGHNVSFTEYDHGRKIKIKNKN